MAFRPASSTLMAGDWLLITAGALSAGGAWVIWHSARKPGSRSFIGMPTVIESTAGNHLLVISGNAVLEQLRLQSLVDGCRDRMGFDYSLFQQDCLPVIQLAAEWTQLLPASESHHHAQPGGLMTHMMESAVHALRFRQGYLLPVGAAPEEIPARKHRWTYAVFLAALLHDIGRPMADINVRVLRSNKPCGKWHPLAGSMVDQGLTHYALDFEITRDYDHHKKLPIVLFQRLVPAHVLAWLAEDVQLMEELTSYLSGEEQDKGALREIVTRADSESVKRNLMQGPRTRFASAKSVPLIERLMQALRLMLEEGRLSLNRAGSHGWVYDGKIWFVSKRLADEVRQFLTERESGEGIPGKDKNDRLFDTWQEYGALIPTKDNRAVWLITVSLDDGWEQKLTVLCFPLDKLFQSPVSYPEPMKGRVVAGNPEEANHEPEPDSLPASNRQNILDEPAHDPTKSDLSGQAGLDVPAPTAAPDRKPTQIGGEAAPRRSTAALRPLRTPALAAAAPEPATLQDEDFLDETDAATSRPARPRPPTAAALKPIAPAGQTAARPKPGSKVKEPSGAAMRFMRWIQEGLADASLSYNRADAMIHFVDEGMMLVSPVIFRKFAELFGEEGDGTPSDRAGSKLGTGIQRQLTNAGWNLVTGEKKSNIQRYMVVGQDGEGKKLMSGVVILDPARFVNPLPPNNPCIVRFDKEIEHV